MKNLSFLKNLTRLEELYLLGEVSSIQQLKVLYGLTSLKHLSLTGPVTTYASAMEELQKALPGCSIEY